MAEQAKKSKKRPAIVGALLGLVIGGASAALAAALSLQTTSIVAGQAGNDGCDESYTVAPASPTFDDSLSAYVVAGVDYTDIDAAACANNTLLVDIIGPSGASIAQVETVIDGGGTGNGTLTFATPIRADQVQSTASALFTP